MKKQASKKTPRKGKSRFVLVVGDEGGILIHMNGTTVMRRLFAISPEPANVKAFNELLEQDPKAHLSILVDMMDQNYARQTLPPVSRLSVNKLMKRRLDKDAGADDLKGAFLLGREKQGRKDWNYMLVSTPNSGALKQWVDYAAERSNVFGGIYLLPLEMEPFILQLAKASHPTSEAEWKFLVSHNKVGGFRQVILHRGRIIFTRMALPIGDSLPEVIAGNIEQEIVNTMEYLKRMGYQDAAGIDIFIVVSSDIKLAIDEKKVSARNLSLLTPYEAAELLELDEVAQPEDHFGDVVVGAFFGRQKKHLLRLQTPYTNKLHLLFQSIVMTRRATAALTLILLGFTGQSVFDITQLAGETGDWADKERAAQSALQNTQGQAQKMPGENIEKISDIASLYKTFDVNLFKPLPFFKQISNALHGELLVQTLEWSLQNQLNVTAAADTRKISATAQLALVKPSDNNEEQKAHWKSALALFEKDFPDFEVKDSGIPGEIGDNETFQTQFGANGNTQAAANKSQLATVTIIGPKKKQESDSGDMGGAAPGMQALPTPGGPSGAPAIPGKPPGPGGVE